MVDAEHRTPLKKCCNCQSTYCPGVIGLDCDKIPRATYQEYTLVEATGAYEEWEEV